jgi:hypothetical protein
MRRNKSFFAEIMGSLLHGFMMLVFAFAIGTGASAIACLYYGVPLVFSLIGGFIVLGLAVVIMYDSSYF